MSIVRALVVLCCLFVVSAYTAPSAGAATEQAGQQKKKRKRSAVLTERTYKRLTRIHQLIGDEKYNEALKQLDVLSRSVGRRRYEKAVVLQTYGFIYASQGKYGKAVDYLQRCLAMDALPEEPEKRLIYNLAQLYIIQGQFRKGIKVLEDWLRTAQDPPSEAYALAGTAYAHQKQYRKAIPHLENAVTGSPEPKESWFKLLLAMHYELKHYPRAAAVLEQMVARFPQEEKYWKQLSSIYLMLKRDDKSLATLELAFTQGYLTDGKELRRLANMYLYMELPYKAAQVLDKGLKSGAIEATKKHWERMGNSWMQAKELDRAIPALKKAATLAADGEIDLRVAYLYIEKEKWREARTALKRALKKGGLKRPGNAHILLGMAAYENGQYDQALDHFRQAQKFEKSKKQATQWLNYIHGELQALN